MEAIFKSRKWTFNKSILIRLLLIFVYLFFCIVILIANIIFGALGIFIGLLALVSIFMSSIKYTLYDDIFVITIKRPFTVKRKIKYEDIIKAERLTSSEAAKVLEDLYKKSLKSPQAAIDLSFSWMYCTSGTIYPPSRKGYTMIEAPGISIAEVPGKYAIGPAYGDFILIEMKRENKEPQQLILTPRDIEGFLKELNSRLSKNK